MVASKASSASPTNRSKSKSQSIMGGCGDALDLLLKRLTLFCDAFDVAGQQLDLVSE
jgi:hypothetical protein